VYHEAGAARHKAIQVSPKQKPGQAPFSANFVSFFRFVRERVPVLSGVLNHHPKRQRGIVGEKSRDLLSLADVLGCENALNQQPARK
jgi:hypothetical protein